MGFGVFHVTLSAGTMPGLDRFEVVADDGIRPVVLAPPPMLTYFAPGDGNGDGVVDVADLVQVILEWGPCPDPPASCGADADGDGMVGVGDLVLVILNWSGG